MTDQGLESLRASHPWPAERPSGTAPLSGWLTKGTQRMLSAVLGPDTRVVVELGSWLGLSAHFILERAPQATLVCVDTWEGSPALRGDPQTASLVPRSHDSFLANLWPHKDRVVPVRSLSWEGLAEVHAAGVKVDVVYVDASHETDDVRRDIETALRLFPGAAIVGDDWKRTSVRAAVEPVAAEHGLRIAIDGNGFRLARTSPADARPAAPTGAPRRRKRSGGTSQVPEDTVAAYSAARAFLLGEWFGASLMVASFTLLYLFAFAPGRSYVPGLVACLGILGVGTWAYLRSRTYYQRVGFDYAPRWHRATIIVAGSAGVFWLLFAFLAALTWFGVAVLPN